MKTLLSRERFGLRWQSAAATPLSFRRFWPFKNGVALLSRGGAHSLKIWLRLCLGTLLLLQVSTLSAQSTAFTYQGRLAAKGAPYTGSAEMQFALFSTRTGGVVVATNTPAIATVNVTGGMFSVSLDFGTGAFSGEDRFLEIQVRTNAGAFSTLTPRQALSPTPYALYARSAGPWSVSGNDAYYTAGNVGIGTATPVAGLHIKKEPIPPGGTLALEGETHTYMTLFPDGVAAGRKSYFGFASSDTSDITIANEFSGGRITLFDSSGVLFPSAGQENLRILCGKVGGDATLLGGSGFAATRRKNGRYTVTFKQPFRGQPTITAIAETKTEEFERYVMISFITDDSFNLEIQINGFGWSDEIFHFIAIGPR